MGLVGLKGEVLVAECEEVPYGAVQAHAREWLGGAAELLARLLEMVQVQVGIAEGEDELAGLEAGDLRHHQRQQRVGGDVEGHAEEYVGAALVHLAGELALGDVELEEG